MRVSAFILLEQKQWYMNHSWPLLALVVLATKATLWSSTGACILELEENSLVREKSFGAISRHGKMGGNQQKKAENIRGVRVRRAWVLLPKWGYYCCHCFPGHSPLLPEPRLHHCLILSALLFSLDSCQVWVEGCGLTSAGWKTELHQQAFDGVAGYLLFTAGPVTGDIQGESLMKSRLLLDFHGRNNAFRKRR